MTRLTNPDEGITAAFRDGARKKHGPAARNLLVYLTLDADYSGPEPVWSGPWHALPIALGIDLPDRSDRSQEANAARTKAATRVRWVLGRLRTSGAVSYPSTDRQHYTITLHLDRDRPEGD